MLPGIGKSFLKDFKPKNEGRTKMKGKSMFAAGVFATAVACLLACQTATKAADKEQTGKASQHAQLYVRLLGTSG